MFESHLSSLFAMKIEFRFVSLPCGLSLSSHVYCHVCMYVPV